MIPLIYISPNGPKSPAINCPDFHELDNLKSTYATRKSRIAPYCTI